MDEQQKFQKPWQIKILKAHVIVEKVVDFITWPIRTFLDSNTRAFQAELDRKPLKSVK